MTPVPLCREFVRNLNVEKNSYGQVCDIVMIHMSRNDGNIKDNSYTNHSFMKCVNRVYIVDCGL